MKPEGLYGEFDQVPTGIYIAIDTLYIKMIAYKCKLKVYAYQNLETHKLLVSVNTIPVCKKKKKITFPLKTELLILSCFVSLRMHFFILQFRITWI
jgi:hypothetical protein